ncbi:MAG: transposase [Tolypothrix carrinoi HA7290-LM1]|nr:transposase [Tolypothrix carrinoi HA7290-LM1]
MITRLPDLGISGIGSTNNAAERAIRPAVIWRRTSFGSQTAIRFS